MQCLGVATRKVCLARLQRKFGMKWDDWPSCQQIYILVYAQGSHENVCIWQPFWSCFLHFFISLLRRWLSWHVFKRKIRKKRWIFSSSRPWRRLIPRLNLSSSFIRSLILSINQTERPAAGRSGASSSNTFPAPQLAPPVSREKNQFPPFFQKIAPQKRILGRAAKFCKSWTNSAFCQYLPSKAGDDV